ncbi:MAG: Nitric oxide reductase FlRd-NAD(+) reductase [bacterium ADurb.Bin429]|nr:MAG: Nitric oxide reductase FlRd-NAD(+) reductase [bacterium ADurb.Bin429]
MGKADFEPHEPVAVARAASAPAVAIAPRQAGIVVVGAGRAGWQVVQALRAQGCTATISMVAACSGDVYDKPQLSVAMARALPVAGLVRETADAAARRLGVHLLADTHAVAVDLPGRRLRTTRGTLRWQALVLAHGSLDYSGDSRCQWDAVVDREPPASTDAWRMIHGEVLTFTEPERLARLDQLEGFHPPGPCLYHRVLAPVRLQGGGWVAAWVYTIGERVRGPRVPLDADVWEDGSVART